MKRYRHRFFDSYSFVTVFNRFFGESEAPFCYTYVAERKSANKIKGALAMKNKKTVFAIVLTIVLVLSIVTVTAAASVNGNKRDKPATGLCVAEADVSGDCAGRSLENFVKDLSFLTEREKEALLADLAEIDAFEKQINEIYSRMTDENADRLYADIDAVEGRLTAVLERNAELWERVNDEYDEKIAAKEPDMTLELNEADLNDGCAAEESYEESIKKMSFLTEREKSALLADLAEIESLEKQIDGLYDRMTDENSDRIYAEIDALYEKLDSVLDRNAELWDRVDAEYDEKIAANEPDMTFELNEDDLSVCEKNR